MVHVCTNGSEVQENLLARIAKVLGKPTLATEVRNSYPELR